MKHSAAPMTIHSDSVNNYHGGRLFHWNEGMPAPKVTKAMLKEQVQQLFHATAGLPYKGEWDPITQSYMLDPEMEDLTIGEVIVMRIANYAAAGNLKAIELFLDRMLGKPKQAVESVSMRMSYAEYLDLLSSQDQNAVDDYPANAVIDVTLPSPPGSIFDDPDEDDDDILGGI